MGAERVVERLQGFLLQVELAEIIVHEACEPNAIVDFLDAEFLAGEHGRDIMRLRCRQSRPQAVTRNCDRGMDSSARAGRRKGVVRPHRVRRGISYQTPHVAVRRIRTLSPEKCQRLRRRSITIQDYGGHSRHSSSRNGTRPYQTGRPFRRTRIRLLVSSDLARFAGLLSRR
jgi:hypothetical protein